MGTGPTSKSARPAGANRSKARNTAPRVSAAPARKAATAKKRPSVRTSAKGARATTTPRGKWSWPALRIGAALRRDVLAVGLVVLAILTGWSLLGGSGGLLGLWAMALRRLFGWGAALLPLALLGWVVDAYRPHPVAPFGPRQRHALGTGLFLLTLLGLMHLPATDALAWGQTGQGGGMVGYLISAPLVAALRPAGAAIVLCGLAIVAIIVTFNTDLRSLGRTAASLVLPRRAARQPDLPARPPDNAKLAATAPATTDPADLPARAERKPIINMPTSAGRPAVTPVVETLPRPPKLRPTLDVPTAPLVVGTGQLPLPATPGAAKEPAPRYRMPPVINLPLYESALPNADELDRKARKIEETLDAFRIEARVREINPGAAVTQFALEPGAGVKVRSIKALENDLALALAASSITIETPIPGQPRVGIVIPNKTIARVGLRETMEAPEFLATKAKLPLALGRDVNGRYIVADLTRMPHLLIAGSTGSGKSVCINGVITTFLLTRSPDDVKLVMVDPKMVELVGYNGIPHLKSPVVIEMDKVVGTLRKALSEMERRYTIFSKLAVRNIDGYRAKRELDPALENLPYLVIIIDELADLMMTAPDEVETVIVRLAQMARATGIHLIIATQRPSVDVLTGLIKANFPARIAFAVASQIDSRVILDAPGAERLLGRGDMLFQPPDAAKPIRVQGTFVDDPDIERIVSHWRQEIPEPQYEPDWVNVPAYKPDDDEDGGDPLMEQALAVVEEHGTISTSMLQRELRIGYNRAARLVEQLEEEGIIGPSEGVRGRTVLGTRAKNPADPYDDAPPWDEE
ncbi:MAG: DNA translocase FtsK 4TM domain-containing protein [Thermomicrobiales bacterium]